MGEESDMVLRIIVLFGWRDLDIPCRSNRKKKWKEEEEMKGNEFSTIYFFLG
jgi:hypothetical protein